jgi:Domain of unknown function (DUF4192)
MDAPTLTPLRTPTDVLAAVPYVLGFTPTDSLIVMGIRAKNLVFQARADLPPPPDAGVLATQLGEVLARQRVTGVVLVGYGPAETVEPTVEAVRDEAERRGITALEVLRATGGRYWSYLCHDPRCCAPEGTPYEVASSAVAASATVAGLSPAGSRAELVARYAPVTGPAALAMRAATARADVRLAELLDGPTAGLSSSDLVGEAGREAVDKTILRAHLGAELTDDEVAWLALLLVNPAVRDYAWSRIGLDVAGQIELWSHIVRRVDPELAAAPATLLAYAAWRHGDGTVASIALDRARDADPNYAMAHLLADMIGRGIPPGDWLDPVEPPELGAGVAGDTPTVAAAPAGLRSRQRRRG